MKLLIQKTGIFFLSTAVLLFVIGLISEVLFHFTVSIAVIFIGIMIFIIAINSKEYTKNSIMKIIGSAYLFVGMLDLASLYLHLGLGVTANSEFKSVQFWIGARFLEALYVLIAAISLRYIKQFKFNWLLLVSFVITCLLAVSIVFEVFPQFFGQGNQGDMTRLITHTVIILFYILAAMLLYLSEYNKTKKNLLLSLIVIKIISAIILIDYATSGHHGHNLGHILMYISYGGLYVLFIADVVNNPYANIFSMFVEREKTLIEKSERDGLTKIYNHSTTFNKIIERMSHNKPEEFGLLMIDIDNFKNVNDEHGHLVGDQVLIKFAELLLNLRENNDIIGRYGGDEFLYLIDHCTKECLTKKREYIKKGLDELSEFFGFEVTVSLGGVTYQVGDSITEFIKKADIKLYDSKAKGKNQLSIWEKIKKDE